MQSDIASDDEYDSNEPPPLVLNFDELTRRASIVVSWTCTRWRKVTKGRFHEIFLLFFSSHNASEDDVKDGDFIETEWSCLARVSREPETVEKLISEVEMMQYIRS